MNLKYLLFLFLISNSCISQNHKYFEGSITFEVKYSSDLNDAYAEYRAGKFGTEMTMFWSENGNQKRITRGAKNGGLEYAIYIQEENIQYLKYVKRDTLYFYDCSINEDTLINSNEIEGIDILNLKTKLYTIEAKSASQGKYEIRYSYSDQYEIDHKLFENLKDGFANKCYKDTKSPFLELVLDFEQYKLKYSAIEVRAEKVDVHEFKLPDFPRKEF